MQLTTTITVSLDSDRVHNLQRIVPFVGLDTLAHTAYSREATQLARGAGRLWTTAVWQIRLDNPGRQFRGLLVNSPLCGDYAA